MSELGQNLSESVSELGQNQCQNQARICQILAASAKSVPTLYDMFDENIFKTQQIMICHQAWN